MANPSGALMLKTLQSWAAPVISWFMLVYNHNKNYSFIVLYHVRHVL